MENTKPTKEQSEIWRKDDCNWFFFKQLYYNKADNRIFPPKRCVWMGWTVNFANTKSVAVFLSIIILLPIIIIIIAEKCFR
jgi:uncharacterized membrane protein